MSEYKTKNIYGKIRIAFHRNEGLPSRIEFIKNFDERSMGNGERAIASLFCMGLHNLCDTCRNAMREMRIATDTARNCPRRNENGLCKDNSHPCNATCKVVVEAINAYRNEVNNAAPEKNADNGK